MITENKRERKEHLMPRLCDATFFCSKIKSCFRSCLFSVKNTLITPFPGRTLFFEGGVKGVKGVKDDRYVGDTTDTSSRSMTIVLTPSS